jgi:hypothetical protein
MLELEFIRRVKIKVRVYMLNFCSDFDWVIIGIYQIVISVSCALIETTPYQMKT